MLTPGTYFITGTDTNVGKTFVSVQLLKKLASLGLSTIALKPIASGCLPTPHGLVNDDALALQQAATVSLPYTAVNPYAFEPPIAPHIAAAQAGVALSVENLIETLTPILNTKAEVKLIEGAGGWLLPLNAQETLADYVTSIQAQVILVVDLKLGCLNHALLTAEAIQQRGLTLAGWVANSVSEIMPHYEENLRFLSEKLGPPLFIQPHVAR